MAGKTFRMPALPPKLVVPLPKVDFQSGGANADVSFEAKGLESLAETLRSMPKVARDAAGYEMANIAHEIIEDAKEHYVPLRFGGLKDSGDADEYDPGKGAEVTEIAMWFGAPGTGITETSVSSHSVAARQTRMLISEGLHVNDPSLYALEQHENMEYRHHPPPDQTGPKYLELPFVKAAPDMAPRIAKAVGISWGTGLGAGEV